MRTDVVTRRPDGTEENELVGLVGHSDEEARARLEAEGPNELPTEKPRGLLAIVLEVVREPMFLMLVAAGVIYLVMGEPSDALMLLGFVFVVMGITVVQERRTERALEALRDLSSPRALVLRSGVTRRIPGREVVRGDLVVLTEGDRVPADAILRRSLHLSTDESLLTGESVPVRKVARPDGTTLDEPGGDDLPSVFSGTLVTAGRGIAEVVAVGTHTKLGTIGKALKSLEPEPTLLQKETRRLVRAFAAVGMVACVVVVVAYAIGRGGGAEAWKQGLLAGIAMAMATLPEEFPVVLTIFLALGAWRISRSRVLTRRMPALEMLGAATVLCVDKTGTLTENRMTLRRLVVDGRSHDLAATSEVPDAFRALVAYASLASRADPFDPMEKALRAAAEANLSKEERLAAATLVREYPLTPERLAVTHVLRTEAREELVVACKGAPEAVAELCRLPPEAREAMLRSVSEAASEGLRILGVARGVAREASLPASPEALEFTFVGLVGLEDPLRPSVPAAVAECREAGIRVVMITGDYPATARSIAAQAGLATDGDVLTGAELARLDDAALVRRVAGVQVVARVVPEQKLRIVEALQASGEVVAMTGDGVNDAPALKRAHIGIAMGGRGTDVAREAASLVLLDDDFSSIVTAIRLGRRVFDNIEKAVAFILAVHVPIVGLSMIPVFVPGWPLLLFPVHIVLLELIIDPTCSLVFEAEEAEADVMRRPPRRPDRKLFSWRTIAVALGQGASVLLACLAVLLLGRRGHGEDAARALTFVTLVVGFVSIILVDRSWSRSALAMLGTRNPALRWVLVGTVSMLALVVFVPAARTLLHFAPLHADDLLLAGVAGVVCVAWFEGLKLLRRKGAVGPSAAAAKMQS